MGFNNDFNYRSGERCENEVNDNSCQAEIHFNFLFCLFAGLVGWSVITFTVRNINVMH